MQMPARGKLYIRLCPAVMRLALASFATITLVSSYYRFQHIVQQAEEKNPEEMGSSASEILHVQFARYLAGCARRNTSFSASLIRTNRDYDLSL